MKNHLIILIWFFCYFSNIQCCVENGVTISIICMKQGEAGDGKQPLTVLTSSCRYHVSKQSESKTSPMTSDGGVCVGAAVDEYVDDKMSSLGVEMADLNCKLSNPCRVLLKSPPLMAGNGINGNKLFPRPVRVQLRRVLSDVRQLFLAEQLVMKIWMHSIGGGC